MANSAFTAQACRGAYVSLLRWASEIGKSV
jgi:hypothetical protein